MRLNNLYLEKSSVLILMLIFSLYLTDCFARDISGNNKNDQISISSYCDDSLQWYDDHPGYKGEFNRVLDYCIEYVKDVSPEGYNVNPILSDFGAINGVNTRPRDSIHQGIDIIGRANEPIIAISTPSPLQFRSSLANFQKFEISKK